MGSVYRARDLHFANVEKIVAVKELIISTTDPILQKTVVENFEREANILATLSHSSIPKIFDYFNHENRSFLVLEYIHGRDLEALIADASVVLSPGQVFQWALELCDVLQYLHNHEPEPIIFRDLKPSNVMVNSDDHIVLVDFGIAKNFQTGRMATIVGTEGYSPPEQYRGEAAPSADIYALGATLHHLLTRHDPRVEAPFSFTERPIREANPDVPAEFEEIVNKALAYNPDERYHTVEEMRKALIGIVDHMHMVDLSTGNQPVSMTSSPSLRWKFECNDEVRGNLTCHDGLLLFGSYDHTLYALNSTQGEIAWTYFTGGGIVGQPCVHDNMVYIGSEDHRLYALSLRNGKLLWTFETRGPIRSSPRVVEDHVIVGSDDACIHAINVNTNRETWTINVSGAIRSSPWVSHEGLIFGCESGDLYSVDLSGQIRWSYRARKAVTSSPYVDQGIVFVTSLDGMLYALDEQEGWLLWKFRMDKGSVSSPCVHEKVVYFGSAGGYLYAINVDNQNLLWKYQVGSQVSGSPVVNGDNLYCGAADGFVYSLDLLSGKLKWKFETQGAITGKPAINQDGLFVGSSDKFIYAVQAISP